MLDLEGLTKHFGGVRAVDGVDLSVARGEILGLIGPNGSGKSTIVNLICGLFAPTAGRVVFNGVDVSGLNVIAVADTPKVMTEGDWRLGVILDAAASDEQAEKLGAVFGGQLGGPMEGLAGLIGENLGVERLPIEFSSEDGVHSVKAGDAIDIEVEDVVPFGSESGEPARLVNIFHPANSELTISKARRSSVKVFGMDLSQDGKSGFSTRFSWAA